MNQTPLATSRIATVCASWHRDIVQRAHDGFCQEWARLSPDSAAPAAFDVPGAFEIPLLAQRLALSGQFDAIVCCGLVVDGGIYRHDLVATAVIDGLMRVQLDTGIPVLSVVLTPHHFHDHDEHRRYFAAHFTVKGQEAASALAQTLRVYHAVDALVSA